MSWRTASRRLPESGLVLTALVAAVVFWRTAYPTITWWDSSQYSLASATLGVTSSPGSLLLTLLGWPVTKLSFGSPAHVLNLFAGVLAAITVGLVYLVALRVLRNTMSTVYTTVAPAAFGAALGALTLAFSATLWEHAIKFTPYVLTAVFTGLILLTMMRWWEEADRPNAWRWLLLLTFLFGLDFSVHRTNALLIPGAIAWIAVRQPRTFVRPRAVFAAIGGMALGLSLQLAVMPLAGLTSSPLNVMEPTSWARFWDYVSLAQSGGGFLFDLWPRNSAFWSVQLMDLMRVLRDNFMHKATSVFVIGWLPAFVALAGWYVIWRYNRRLCIAFTLACVLQALMTVLYFNIPADYFRPFDRHYLPVCVTLGVFVAVGLGAVMQEIARLATRREALAVAAAVLAFVLVPAGQLIGNWSARDASDRWFARDFAVNALESLPPNAIYFTVGDNDTFPVLYMQSAEGVRRDVRIVNLSLANAAWYMDQIARRDTTFPVARGADGRRVVTALGDTKVVIPVAATAAQLGLPPDTTVPLSVTVRAQPRVGTDFLAADSVLFDILRTNAWRAPVTVAITAGRSGLGWLEPYSRLEGLHWRVVPVPNLGPDRDTLRANLFERYEYRGYADRSVMIDDTSRTIAYQYFMAFQMLQDADAAHGASDRCREAAERVVAVLPPDRFGFPGFDREGIAARCR